jgi:antirestriction protein ArdC
MRSFLRSMRRIRRVSQSTTSKVARFESSANRPALHLTSEHEYRAYYRPSTDSVHMPARARFVDAPHYYSTLFHELIHSTGHESRLNRTFGNGFGDELHSAELADYVPGHIMQSVFWRSGAARGAVGVNRC